MRAATHGCNEGSIEAGWLGQSHLPVMLNYVPTTGLTDESASPFELNQPGCLGASPPRPSVDNAGDPKKTQKASR